MRVVVIGASGNIGTALLRRLHLEGDVEVVGASRRRPPATSPYDRAVQWTTVDLADPGVDADLRALVAGADAVVNLAWGFQPTRRPHQLEQTGVGGTRRVLAAAIATGVPAVVQLSSVGAYAPRRDTTPVDESYPATGVPSSLYSRHKAAAEALLDRAEAEHGEALRIVRIRPGFVLQRDAGASLARYGLPPWLPRQLLGHVPVVPLPAGLVLPVVHTSDLADAVALAVRGEVWGAFNVAADPPLVADDVAAALGGRAVTVPAAPVRAVVDLSWRARVQPIDAGWFDLALQVPLMDTGRARSELGWRPMVDPRRAFEQAVDGIARGRGVAGAVLGPRRSPVDVVRTVVREGSISRRRLS